MFLNNKTTERKFKNMITNNLSQVTLEKSNEAVTGKGGLVWIYHCLKHYGLEKIVKAKFQKKHSNRQISAWQKIMTGVLMLIAGGERIEDIENNIISPDTFLNFLRSKATGTKIQKINEELVVKAMKESKLNSFTYDNDWDIEPMDWLDVHNGRMNSENYNKELKSGFAASYTPSHNFQKNRTYFMINILAYNSIQIMKLYYLDHQENWTIKTIRYRFIFCCIRFIKHARNAICRIINVTDESFSLFRNAWLKLHWI
jgi:hypothetical protein